MEEQEKILQRSSSDEHFNVLRTTNSSINRLAYIPLLFTGFVNYWEWCVIMASIYPYIKTFTNDRDDRKGQLYLALALSSHSLLQGLSLPVSAKLVKRFSQMKGVLLLLLLISIVGNLMYIAGSSVGMVALVILGRAVAGAGAAMGGVVFRYLVTNVRTETRARTNTWYRMASMAGVILAMLASATFLPLFGDEDNAAARNLELDQYTAPAAMSVLLLSIDIILVVILFKEDEKNYTNDSHATVSIRGFLTRRGIILTLLMFFLVGYLATWLAYTLPLVCFPFFSWTIMKFAWLLVGVFGAAMTATVVMSLFVRSSFMFQDGELKVVLISCGFLLVGVLLYFLGAQPVLKSVSYTSKEAMFITGTVLVAVMYSVCGVVLPKFATKFVPKAAVPVLLPYCVGVMSFGKVLAPVLTEILLWIQGWELAYLFTLVFVAMVLLLFPFLYRIPGPEQQPLVSGTPCIDRMRRYVEISTPPTTDYSPPPPSTPAVLHDCNQLSRSSTDMSQ